MPNWCMNEITITGDSNEIDTLLMNAEGPDETKAFSMEALVPCPNNENWYEWNINNWGTKWDFVISKNDLIVIKEPNTTKVLFNVDTAWSPPLAFWQKVSKLYPFIDIKVYYEEEGIGFIGMAKFKQGKMRNKERRLTAEVYKRAGAKLTPEGVVDWDVEQEYDLRKLFK